MAVRRPLKTFLFACLLSLEWVAVEWVAVECVAVGWVVPGWHALGSGSLFAAEVEQTDVQLSQVNQAIASIELWINDAANNRSSLERNLRAANQQIQENQQALTENQTVIAAQQTELLLLQERRQLLEIEKSAQESIVGQALRASQLLGGESSLKLLLNQQDPGPSARMLRYYAAFNEDRLTQILNFQKTLAAMQQTSDAIAATAASLEARNAVLEEQLAAAQIQQRERAAIVQALEAEMAARSNELEQLIQDRQHLENLISEINRIVDDIPAPQDLAPFAQSQGLLPWPVNGALLNRFGANYSEGNLQRQGVIISAAEGSPVRAIHPGRVVFSDWLRGSGYLVVLDHGNGYLSLYAHNQGLVKQTGDWANRGEIIGAAGNDAGMGSAGIYFEIRQNGQAQNPVNWCVDL